MRESTSYRCLALPHRQLRNCFFSPTAAQAAQPPRPHRPHRMGKIMNSFIGYTLGLECFVGARITSVKIEYSRRADGSVKLQAVSGNNLGAFAPKHSRVISAEAYDSRPSDTYTGVPETLWALSLVGLRPAGMAT